MQAMQAISGNNPAGIYINDGWYALEAAIRYNLTVDEAIYRITGTHLNNSAGRQRPPRGTVKKKIIELHQTFPEKDLKTIADDVGCSVEMVKYTLIKQHKKHINTNTTKEDPKQLPKKSKKTVRKEQVFRILEQKPERTIAEIVVQTGYNYQEITKYVRQYYRSLQTVLPFEFE